VGAYPFAEAELDEFGERVARYLRKVTREAKVHMTHREPDPVYEEGFVDFATRILDRAAPNPFLDDFLPFQRRIAHYGAINSLSQTLLKICSPGVPDFYQGSELWDLTLVDPDNRRPVDFELRRRMLEDMLQVDTDAMAGMIAEMLSDVTDGRVKLFLIQRALAARKNNAYLFERAGYIGLRASGEFSRHVVAFARVHAKSYAICIAPRLAVGLVDEGTFPMDRGVWGDTHVIIPEDAPRAWKDAISGQRVVCTGKLMIGDALATFPVSMLLEDTE
jgi:(1->4)-alpha-D-glucan 1-alpha-D-glucosylmutase